MATIDILSISNGVNKRYGFIYVDRTDANPKDCRRIQKYSVYWYQKVIQAHVEKLKD